MSMPVDPNDVQLDAENLDKILNESLLEMGLDPEELEPEVKEEIRNSLIKELQQELALETLTDNADPNIADESDDALDTPQAPEPERMDASGQASAQPTSPSMISDTPLQQSNGTGGMLKGILLGTVFIGILALMGAAGFLYFINQDKLKRQSKPVPRHDGAVAETTPKSTTPKSTTPKSTTPKSTTPKSTADAVEQPISSISDKSLWKITASRVRGGNRAEFAIDGDLDTRWSTGLPAKKTNWLVWDLGKLQKINGLQIFWYARQEFDYLILASTDGKEWASVGQGEKRTGVCNHKFYAAARYLKIDCVKSSGGWFAINELSLLGGEMQKMQKAQEKDAKAKPRIFTPLERSTWKVTASADTGLNRAEYAIDGDLETRWASSICDPPYWISWDLGKSQQIDGLQIQWWSPKKPYTYDVLASNDGQAWKVVVNGVEEIGVSNHHFDTKARFLKVFCKESKGLWASIREMNLLEKMVKVTSKDFIPKGPEVSSKVFRKSNKTLWKATASNSTSNRPVTNIFDGNPATRWCSGDTVKVEWVVWDLGQLQEINGIQVVLSKRKTTYDLLTSTDGREWKLQGSQVDAKDSCIHEFSTIARYIKVLCKKVVTNRFYIGEMSLLEQERAAVSKDEVRPRSPIMGKQDAITPIEASTATPKVSLPSKTDDPLIKD